MVSQPYSKGVSVSFPRSWMSKVFCHMIVQFHNALLLSVTLNFIHGTQSLLLIVQRSLFYKQGIIAFTIIS